jgi:hypothetical protein
VKTRKRFIRENMVLCLRPNARAAFRVSDLRTLTYSVMFELVAVSGEESLAARAYYYHQPINAPTAGAQDFLMYYT